MIINCHTADPDEYARAAFQFNTALPKPNPCVIVMANNSKCIQGVVNQVTSLRNYDRSKYQHLQIAVRGGRHSYIGASTKKNGVVVDVSRFDSIQQHDGDGLMTVGAGITLGKLYYQLWKSYDPRLLYSGGSCPTVGLSGLTLGGGQGVTGHKYGLSADQVKEVKMVNSHGKLNKSSHEDLFWALRGGGNGNYGIVLSVYPQSIRDPRSKYRLSCLFL